MSEVVTYFTLQLLIYFHFLRSQRRLSDPSANINNFVRGGWKSKLDSKSRSEQEGLDNMDNGVSEIEAGDLRDGKSRKLNACQSNLRVQL